MFVSLMSFFIHFSGVLKTKILFFTLLGMSARTPFAFLKYILSVEVLEGPTSRYRSPIVVSSCKRAELLRREEQPFHQHASRCEPWALVWDRFQILNTFLPIKSNRTSPITGLMNTLPMTSLISDILYLEAMFGSSIPQGDVPAAALRQKSLRRSCSFWWPADLILIWLELLNWK